MYLWRCQCDELALSQLASWLPFCRCSLTAAKTMLTQAPIDEQRHTHRRTLSSIMLFHIFLVYVCLTVLILTLNVCCNSPSVLTFVSIEYVLSKNWMLLNPLCTHTEMYADTHRNCESENCFPVGYGQKDLKKLKNLAIHEWQCKESWTGIWIPTIWCKDTHASTLGKLA